MYMKEFPSIAESVETLEGRLKYERDARLRLRLHLLILIRSGRVQTRCQAAEHLAVHRNSVGNWLARYRAGGLDKLLQIGRGGPPREQQTLPPSVLKALQEHLNEPGFSSYTDIQRWLREEYAQTVPYRTVHGLVRDRLKAKLKRARPRHVKKTPPMPPPSPLS